MPKIDVCEILCYTSLISKISAAIKVVAFICIRITQANIPATSHFHRCHLFIHVVFSWSLTLWSDSIWLFSLWLVSPAAYTCIYISNRECKQSRVAGGVRCSQPTGYSNQVLIPAAPFPNLFRPVIHFTTICQLFWYRFRPISLVSGCLYFLCICLSIYSLINYFQRLSRQLLSNFTYILL